MNTTTNTKQYLLIFFCIMAIMTIAISGCDSDGTGSANNTNSTDNNDTPDDDSPQTPTINNTNNTQPGPKNNTVPGVVPVVSDSLRVEGYELLQSGENVMLRLRLKSNHPQTMVYEIRSDVLTTTRTIEKYAVSQIDMLYVDELYVDYYIDSAQKQSMHIDISDYSKAASITNPQDETVTFQKGSVQTRDIKLNIRYEGNIKNLPIYVGLQNVEGETNGVSYQIPESPLTMQPGETGTVTIRMTSLRGCTEGTDRVIVSSCARPIYERDADRTVECLSNPGSIKEIRHVCSEQVTPPDNDEPPAPAAPTESTLLTIRQGPQEGDNISLILVTHSEEILAITGQLMIDKDEFEIISYEDLSKTMIVVNDDEQNPSFGKTAGATAQGFPRGDILRLVLGPRPGVTGSHELRFNIEELADERGNTLAANQYAKTTVIVD